MHPGAVRADRPRHFVGCNRNSDPAIETTMQDESRRGFLRRAFGAVGAFFAALFGVPAAATVLDPALRGSDGAWVDAGAAADVKEGEAKRFSYTVRSAWEERQEAGFLVRTNDALAAFSATCTHLGCKVRFKEGKFHCPCHQGRFALDGAVEAGPPERPLDRFEFKVENGQVKVKV